MTETVLVYDTTLRDGMQGEGMSLSAHEKVRVAHALDELGVHMIEAGFPASNPKEEELFALLAAERFETAQVAAFGMTRRKDVAAADDPALRLLADCFVPICTLVGKTWSLHLEKVTQVDPEENLRMIADSVAFLAGEGKRVVYDAEHFFDAFRDDPDYALRCLHAAAEAGAENVTLCDTNGSSLPTQVAEATARVVAELGDSVQVGIHTHDDSGCGVANALLAVEQGARMVQGTMNGYGERCGNANLITILPALELKLGYETIGSERMRRLTETAHLMDDLCNVTPNPNQPYVGANAFAHKGGMHVAGINRDARTFEHMDPAEVGADRRVLVSELSGKGTVQARADVDDADRRGGGRARQGAREPRLPVRGRRRLVRPADPQADGRVRAAVSARELARDRREARERARRDRGHDQDLGRRRALRAHRGGQRSRARARPGAALGDRRALPAPRRHRADQLQGSHPRREQGHRRGHARADRRRRRQRHVGRDRRVREHHRGELGRAGGLARGGHAPRTRAARAGARRDDVSGAAGTGDFIPLARPLVGPREEELVLETLRSRRLALGPRLPEFETAFGTRLGVEHVSAVSSGTAGLHLAIRAAGVEAGDEVVTTPFSFVASANCLLYEDARPVFCDIDPRTLNIDPQAAAAAVGERTTGLLPVHIFGYPADLPALERLASERGLWLVEDACEALGAVHADGSLVGARGNLSVFGFYPNKQLTTGEGGVVVAGTPALKERIDSERNQGRAPDMGWLDHDRLGFNYRLDDLSCALGIAQLERLDDMLAAASARRGAVRRGACRHRGPPDCPARTPTATCAAGSSTSSSCPHGVDRDATDHRAARARRRLQAVPARDPPDELLPRALRPPRGRVPRLRGRRRPLAGAAVLPGADATRRSSGWSRRCAR